MTREELIQNVRELDGLGLPPTVKTVENVIHRIYNHFEAEIARLNAEKLHYFEKYEELKKLSS